MEYHIEAGPKTKKYIEILLPDLLKELGLDHCRKYLMIRVDKDMEHAGTTVPMLGIDTILVVIKPVRDRMMLGITLAHELVHVAQFAKGLLKPTKNGNKWCGKFYPRKTPYLYQPWEVQAFAKQEIVFRRILERTE